MQRSDLIGQCVFWEIDQSQRTWLTRGCVHVDRESNPRVTTCECDHLTIFAVLLNNKPVSVIYSLFSPIFWQKTLFDHCLYFINRIANKSPKTPWFTICYFFLFCHWSHVVKIKYSSLFFLPLNILHNFHFFKFLFLFMLLLVGLFIKIPTQFFSGFRFR